MRIVVTGARLKPLVLELLAGHGLAPSATASPESLRDAVRDLYRFEIRRLRRELLAGRIVKRDYAGHVVALRERYPLLSLPLPLWTEPTGPQDPPLG